MRLSLLTFALFALVIGACSDRATPMPAESPAPAPTFTPTPTLTSTFTPTPVPSRQQLPQLTRRHQHSRQLLPQLTRRHQHSRQLLPQHSRQRQHPRPHPPRTRGPRSTAPAAWSPASPVSTVCNWISPPFLKRWQLKRWLRSIRVASPGIRVSAQNFVEFSE